MPATLSIITNVFTDRKERAQAIAIWAGHGRRGRRHRPGDRRLPARALLVGVGVPGQRARRRSSPWCSASCTCPPRGTPRRRPSTCPARCCRSPASSRSCGRSSRAPTGWTDPRYSAPSPSSAVLLGAFVLWERHTPTPMLDINFFRNPRFSAASGALRLTFFAMFGSLFLLTQFLQSVLGYTALEAGVRLLPMAAVQMVVAPLSRQDGRAGGHQGHRGDRPGIGAVGPAHRQPADRRRRLPRGAGRRWSCWPSAWRWSCRPPPSRSWAPCRRPRRAWARRSTTRPARSAARWAWRCSARS